MSAEQRRKIGDALRGVPLTEAHRRRISAGRIRMLAIERYRAEQARERSGA